MTTTRYQLESEIEAIVSGFESCQTGKESFPHRSHLTVAVWYLHQSDLDQATDRMRQGLFRFLEHHGVGQQKYHETLTVFWLQAVRKHMDALSPKLTLLEIANSVIEALVDSRFVYEYYSPERINSAEARKAWLEPDLKEL